MNQKRLFALWAVLFIVCAGLGFIPEPSGILKAVLTLAALGFFIPGALLLYQAGQEKNAHVLSVVRNLAAVSLVLTLVLLVLNFLTAFHADWIGSMLYGMLVIISTPMVCSGYWALSLFLWACLLMGSIQALRKCRAS